MEVCECLMKFSFLCFRFSFRGRDVTVANTGIAENLPELMVKLNVCVHLTNLGRGLYNVPGQRFARLRRSPSHEAVHMGVSRWYGFPLPR